MEEVKVPSPGESISEVDIASWLVEDGDYVEEDDVIAEIDSDKATLELTATASGAISLVAEEGDTVNVGSVVAKIDTSVEAPAEDPSAKEEEKEVVEVKEEKEEVVPAKEEVKPAAKAGGAEHAKRHPSPAAKKMMKENNISSPQIQGSGKDGRI